MTSGKIAKDTEVCPEDSLRYAGWRVTLILSILSAITAVAALAMLTLPAYRFPQQTSASAGTGAKSLLTPETGAALESN